MIPVASIFCSVGGDKERSTRPGVRRGHGMSNAGPEL